MKTELSEIWHRAFKEQSIISEKGALSLRDIEQPLSLLKSYRVSRREGIGLCFDNGPECLAVYGALAELDAVAIPLPPTIPEGERKRLWAALGCRLSTDKKGVTLLLDEAKKVPIWPDDIHWVMHSSGSTGIPKAIALTLSAFQKNAEQVMEALGFCTPLLHLGTMSQCYTNGLYNSFYLPLLTGSKVLVGPVASALKLGAFLDLLWSGQPDLVWVNPTVVNLLIRRASVSDLNSVKSVISCTAPLVLEDCLAAERQFQCPVLQSYGLTETLIVSIESPSRKADSEFSAGVVVGGSTAVTVDSKGLLVVHNGAVTPGYATKKESEIVLEFPDSGRSGYSFVSGDIVTLHETGRLSIVGRETNVINVEGVKISPEQLEELLCSCPGIDRAVVLGVKNGGIEKPVAIVKGRSTMDSSSLADLCVHHFGVKARPLKVLFVPEIPLTANGKVDRPASLSLFSEKIAALPSQN